MSLDVYLEGPPTRVECVCVECGNEHSRPAREGYFFHANITHNLSEMADAAGIYEVLWRPEECRIIQAKQLAPFLRDAIKEMKANPAKFEAHNAPNGWGIYEDFVPWLERYLAACEEYPEAYVRASR